MWEKFGCGSYQLKPYLNKLGLAQSGVVPIFTSALTQQMRIEFGNEKKLLDGPDYNNFSFPLRKPGNAYLGIPALSCLCLYER